MGTSIKFRLIVMAAVGAFVVLCGLGTWQVYRLQWKEALIAETQARIQRPPIPIGEAEARWQADGDVDYLPVELAGEYLHQSELYYYNTLKGTVGWNVFTPLQLADGRLVLVNRGFVPDAYKDPDTRKQFLQSGSQNIVGLARNPLFEKPNRFVPDNDLSNRSFFWKSYPQMIDLAKGAGGEPFLPFFVDAGKSNIEGALPVGGTTRISFPNNHLQYAITWYGLAAALVLVGGFFIRSSRSKTGISDG